MATLNDKITELENQIRVLQAKVEDLTAKTEADRIKPESKVSQPETLKNTPLPSTGTGLGRVFGTIGNMIFNDAEVKRTPFGTQPSNPTKGYNKHSHSKYSGGALDIHTLQLVEYDTSDPEAVDPIILAHDGTPLNKHCQSYWNILPRIKKTDNGTEKIGMLEIEFDPETKKWVTGSKEIDVEKTNLVEKDEDGNLVRDDKGNEKKAPLNGESLFNHNVVWDENAQCWRFYAVFADEEGI